MPAWERQRGVWAVMPATPVPSPFQCVRAVREVRIVRRESKPAIHMASSRPPER